MTDPWFDPNTFGAWFGAIAGSTFGVMGGVLGSAAGILAPQGKGKRIVLGLWVLVMVAAAVMLLFGLTALVVRQPWGIWYGPVLCGGLTLVIFGSLLPIVLMRYREAEHRRVDADGIRAS